MHALGAAVLADIALGRRVRQVDPQHLGIAAAGDEGGAEAQEHPAQVQHEPVRHVALAQQGAHLVRPHLAAPRVGPGVASRTIIVLTYLGCTQYCTKCGILSLYMKWTFIDFRIGRESHDISDENRPSAQSLP